MFNEGTYGGVFNGLEFGESNTGTPHVIFHVTATHQQIAKEWHAIEPTDRRVYRYLSEGAKKYTYDDLAYVGWNGDADNPVCTKENEKVRLGCKHETYKGETREKWSLYTSEGKKKAEFDDEMKRQLTAEFRHHVQSSGGNVAQVAQPPSTVSTTNYTQQDPVANVDPLPEDDIPF